MMGLDFKSGNGVTVPPLSGRLDSAASGPAEQEISAELSRGGSRIALMRAQEYVSSTGLRVFLPMTGRRRAAGGKLARGVSEVFGISVFSTISAICGDRNGDRAALK